MLTADAEVHACERNHPGIPVGTLAGPAEVLRLPQSGRLATLTPRLRGQTDLIADLPGRVREFADGRRIKTEKIALAASTASRVSCRCHRVSGSDKPQTDGFGSLLPLGYIDGDALPFRQPHDAGTLQRRGVHEDILSALIRSDKAEALIGVVPFHRS